MHSTVELVTGKQVEPTHAILNIWNFYDRNEDLVNSEFITTRRHGNQSDQLKLMQS